MQRKNLLVALATLVLWKLFEARSLNWINQQIDSLVQGQSAAMIQWLLLLIPTATAVLLFLAVLAIVLQKAPQLPWLSKLLSGRTVVEFFPTRDDLDRCYPVTEQLRRADNMKALWLTGRAFFEKDLDLVSGVLTHLVLPRPDAQIVSTLSQLEWENLPESIAGITRTAHKHGIKVKWYSGFTGMTFSIARKGKRKGWAHIENLLPTMSPNERSVIRIDGRVQRTAFQTLEAAFDQVWGASDDPDEQLLNKYGTRNPSR
jgi:hypothetical protein